MSGGGDFEKFCFLDVIAGIPDSNVLRVTCGNFSRGLAKHFHNLFSVLSTTYTLFIALSSRIVVDLPQPFVLK
jgi:hypothetical protein